MNRLHTRLSTWTIALCMFFVLSGISAMAKPQASPPTTKPHYNHQEEKEEARQDEQPRPPISPPPRYFGHHRHEKSKKSKKAYQRPPMRPDTSAATSDTAAKKTSKKSKKAAAAMRPAHSGRVTTRDRAPPPPRKPARARKPPRIPAPHSSGSGRESRASCSQPADTTAAPTKRTRKSKKSAMDFERPQRQPLLPARLQPVKPRLRRRPQQLQPVPWLPLRTPWHRRQAAPAKTVTRQPPLRQRFRSANRVGQSRRHGLGQHR